MKHPKDKIILSASAISTYKACPWKYRNSYYYGIRKTEKHEALRIGSMYHAGQEIAMLKPGAVCTRCANKSRADKNCFICQGTTFLDDPMQAIARMLNYKYDTAYGHINSDSKKRERAMIMYCLFAYINVWEDQQFDLIAPELPFRIPLIDPDTRVPVPNVFIDGVIDKLIDSGGCKQVMEHKSTASQVEADSDYWGSLRLDTQTTLYLYAAQRLQANGELIPFGIKPEDSAVSDVLYDVWRKPQSKPKKLSKEDSMNFLMEGEYFNRKFDLELDWSGEDVMGCKVDGEPAIIEHLKDKNKSPVIRETEDMFGCRIFDAVTEEPSKWFARKPLAKSPEEMVTFERELYSIAMNIIHMRDNNSWFHNEKHCEARAKCDYCHLCYSGKQVDTDNVPDGFENIFAKGK